MAPLVNPKLIKHYQRLGSLWEGEAWEVIEANDALHGVSPEEVESAAAGIRGVLEDAEASPSVAILALAGVLARYAMSFGDDTGMVVDEVIKLIETHIEADSEFEWEDEEEDDGD